MIATLRANNRIAKSTAGTGTCERRELPLTEADVVVGFAPHVTSLSDYYPFGSGMEGRTVDGSYRYSFQGQETDAEYFNGAVSFKYRVHDARLGRFLSIDPLAAEFPWNSAYAFSENRVVDGVELEGLERMDANGKIIYANISLRTFTAGLTKGSQWGGGNTNGPSFGHVPRKGGMVRVEWLQCLECQDQWSSGNQWFWRVQQQMPRIQPIAASQIPTSVPQATLQTPVTPLTMTSLPAAGPSITSGDAPTLSVDERIRWSSNENFFDRTTMSTGESRLRQIGEAMANDPSLLYRINIGTPHNSGQTVGSADDGSATSFTGRSYAVLLEARFNAVVDYVTTNYPSINRDRFIPNFQPGTNQDFSVSPIE